MYVYWSNRTVYEVDLKVICITTSWMLLSNRLTSNKLVGDSLHLAGLNYGVLSGLQLMFAYIQEDMLIRNALMGNFKNMYTYLKS